MCGLAESKPAKALAGSKAADAGAGPESDVESIVPEWANVLMLKQHYLRRPHLLTATTIWHCCMLPAGAASYAFSNSRAKPSGPPRYSKIARRDFAGGMPLFRAVNTRLAFVSRARWRVNRRFSRRQSRH